MPLDVTTTLVGVAVGALLSTTGTVFLDRVRYRHELHVRWDMRKSEAFAAYLDAVATMSRSAGQAAAHRSWDDRAAAPGTLEEAIASVEAAQARRSVLFEVVVLLGNERTIHAGQELNRVLWSLEWLGDGRRKGSAEAWLDARERFKRALHEFHTATREDLKVPGSGPSEVVVEDMELKPEIRSAPPGSDRTNDTLHAASALSRLVARRNSRRT